MIQYQSKLSLRLAFGLKGSVFPRALAWAIPAAIFAAVLNVYVHEEAKCSGPHVACSAEDGVECYSGLAASDEYCGLECPLLGEATCGVPGKNPGSHCLCREAQQSRRVHIRHGDWIFNVEGVAILWSSYSFVLGFLVVFRNGQAYNRFWEGAKLIHQIRGEWINASSSITAFCTQDLEKKDEVEKFQHYFMRLMSMLHCAALQQIAEVSDHSLEVIDPVGLDMVSLEFLKDLLPESRCQVLLQWIQRLVVAAADPKVKVLDVPPPILSRVYQQLSRGMVLLEDVTTIKQVPIPFPYAQMIAVMMILHWITTPVLASQAIESWFWASLMTLIVVLSFWCLYNIANEIEQPFGKDANDLPIVQMQDERNRDLCFLLKPELQTPPSFNFCAEHRKVQLTTNVLMVPQWYNPEPIGDWEVIREVGNAVCGVGAAALTSVAEGIGAVRVASGIGAAANCHPGSFGRHKPSTPHRLEGVGEAGPQTASRGVPARGASSTALAEVGAAAARQEDRITHEIQLVSGGAASSGPSQPGKGAADGGPKSGEVSVEDDVEGIRVLEPCVKARFPSDVSF